MFFNQSICWNLISLRRLLIFLLLFCFLPVLPALAQNFSAGDIIAAVNALRASQGLAAYQVDSELMAFAKAHSQYQASIGQSTHTRADGSTSLAYGVVENIASGSASFMTVDYIISQIWADAIHMKTMLGYESGYVGAGVVVSGGSVYVTLNVRPGQSAGVSPGQAKPGGAVPTQIALAPLVTATPDAHGALLHVVGYGQSLWSIAIAYGVKIDEIRTLNGLIPGSTDIYAGQRLVIRPAGSFPTPTISIDTAVAAEQEPVPTDAAPTQLPTLTPAPSPSPLPSPAYTATPASTHLALPQLPRSPLRRLLAYMLIAVGVAGALFFIINNVKSRAG